MPRFDTLHAVLPPASRADRQITFIDGQDEQRTLPFARLRQRAAAALGALQRRGVRAGDAMLLHLADNERFLEMFWACVLGGIVPVPLAPGGSDEHRRKLFRVCAQFDSAWLGTDATALDRLDAFAAANALTAEAARLRSRTVLAASLDVAGAPGELRRPSPDDLAFIQYSSGSTGEPKGVMLTHRNLGANIDAIIGAARFTDRDTALSWMPLSHDMGLIGFHLTMLACGIDHAIMRTELFARRPLLWLELASQRRTTVLCSPNFGYQHTLGQYAARPPHGLDLSAVRLIFNGAEPISAGLCRRFAQAMAPHGLQATSLFPVYGLAEASLAVSFPRPGAMLETVELDATALRAGEPVRAAVPGAGRAIEFVKLGRPLPCNEVRITGDAGTALGDRVFGSVQIRGGNVSRGYHREDEATARLRSADGWLDTGDLGFFCDGQLVIAGRAKDLIIVNGQNVHPDDLERIAADVPGIEVQRVAAAGVRVGGETEALAFFVQHRAGLAEFVPRAAALRRTIAERTGLEVARVVPVVRIPKTSSGKLQRHALAQAFEQGEFDAVLAELAPLLAEQGDAAGPEGASTVRRLLAICARVLPDHALTPQTDLLEINLNSLSLARIHEAIDHEFPQRIEVTDLFDYPTLQQLADFIDANPH